MTLNAEGFATKVENADHTWEITYDAKGYMTKGVKDGVQCTSQKIEDGNILYWTRYDKENDVKMESAEKIAASGVKYYIEVANMPTTNDALNFLRGQKHMVVAPSKAVNAGGVGVSGLEMSQNSERLSWTAEEVDAQLHKMMKNIHKVSAEAAEEYGLGYDLVAGANIAGFKKVAEAMYEQGVF